MKCPFCRSATTEVYNTRATKFGAQIWRRRQCASCKESFTTYEAADLGFIKIEKKHFKKPEPYSRAKLFSSIYGAFMDVKGRQNTVDAVTETVETKLLDLQQHLVSSAQLADIVLQTLRHYNTAAFVRYLTNQTDVLSEAQLRKELKKY